MRLPPILRAIASQFEPDVKRAYLDAIRELRYLISLEAMEVAVADGSADRLFDLGLMTEELRPATALVEALTSQAVDAAEAKLQNALRKARRAIPEIEAPVWDVANQAAIDWAQRRAARLVVDVTFDQQSAIRLLIRDGFTRGRTVQQTARLIRADLGLTARQAQAVSNLETRLRGSGLTDEQVERKVAAYAQRSLRFRADMIARTETLMASNRGQEIVWEKAVRAGELHPDYVMKEWLVGPEGGCQICSPMRGQRTRIDGVWLLPNGKIVRTPTEAHPHCRCTSVLEFSFPEGW